MSRIAVIDDDFAAESLVSYLIGRGYDAVRYRSAEEAMKSLPQLVEFDLVIVDVLMARPTGIAEERASGGFQTGLVIAQALRGQKPNLPIIALSATTDQTTITWFAREPHSRFLSKLDSPSADSISGVIDAMLGTNKSAPQIRSFIVHGHDENAKWDLKNFLQNSLGFEEPIILHEQPSRGKTIIEKFEFYSGQADLAFVLLTPDDKGASVNDSNDEKRRARQNVIFELGYFLGVFGRQSGRVFFLHKGDLELPSDLSGIVYIDISKGVLAAGEQIRKELSHVCPL